MAVIVIVTEQALQPLDVQNILSLHAPDENEFHVLVPRDTSRSLVVDFIDHLSLGELREAWEELTHPPSPEETRTEAETALAASLSRFADHQARAEGAVIADDPIPALRQVVNTVDAADLIVVTRPHAVEDTFHRDWASRARRDLGVPVLHLYSGTNQLG